MLESTLESLVTLILDGINRTHFPSYADVALGADILVNIYFFFILYFFECTYRAIRYTGLATYTLIFVDYRHLIILLKICIFCYFRSQYLLQQDLQL
jgi:hypothetical protein